MTIQIKLQAKLFQRELSLQNQGTPMIQAGKQFMPTIAISLGAEILKKIKQILNLRRNSIAKQQTLEIILFNSNDLTRIIRTVYGMGTEQMGQVVEKLYGKIMLTVLPTRSIQKIIRTIFQQLAIKTKLSRTA